MKVLILAVAMVMSSAAFAQKHMVQFGTTTTTLADLAWSSEKSRGASSQEQKSASLNLNYARTITSNIQVGAELHLDNQSQGDKKSSDLGVHVGGYYNLSSDLRNSYYASVFVGWDWGNSNAKDEEISRTETFVSTVAVGKRFALPVISENFTYSPEIAFVSENPTKSSGTEWRQSLELRVIQFSLFY